MVVATVEGVAWLSRRRPRLRKPLVAWMLLWSVACAFVRSPLPIGANAGQWVGPNTRTEAKAAALAQLPTGANVSVTDGLAAQLSRGTFVYEFPNPFEPNYYGPDGKGKADPATVDWILLDTVGLKPERIALLKRLTGSGGTFAIVWQRDGLVVARRR